MIKYDKFYKKTNNDINKEYVCAKTQLRNQLRSNAIGIEF